MRILVSVASKHGGTAEIGDVIYSEFALDPTVGRVDLMAPVDVASVAGYDVVVLGSAVYADAWLPEMAGLVERLAGELLGRSVHLFCSGPMGPVTDPRHVPTEVRTAAERIGAESVRSFGGKVDRQQLGSVERTVMRMKGARDGDWRDLDGARDWARQILTQASRPLAG